MEIGTLDDRMDGMPNLQVRNMDARLYNQLRVNAKLANRSISQHVITILQEKTNSPHTAVKNAVDEFLALGDCWGDERTAEELVSEIRNSRTNKSQSKTGKERRMSC